MLWTAPGCLLAPNALGRRNRKLEERNAEIETRLSRLEAIVEALSRR